MPRNVEVHTAVGEARTILNVNCGNNDFASPFRRQQLLQCLKRIEQGRFIRRADGDTLFVHRQLVDTGLEGIMARLTTENYCVVVSLLPNLQIQAILSL